jgi:hypothetical protein
VSYCRPRSSPGSARGQRAQLRRVHGAQRLEAAGAAPRSKSHDRYLAGDMTQEPQDRAGFWPAIVVIALSAAAAWAIFLLIQPACGAPGNTALGRSNRWVPWTLLATEIHSTAIAGKLLRRPAPVIIGGIVVGSVLAATAAIIVFLFWFGSSHCGE